MRSDMPIGIDRRLQLTWLESAANMVMAGTTNKEIAQTLHQMLMDKLSSGEGGRGSLEKTVTNIMKIWVTTPMSLRPSRDEGLKMLQSSSPGGKLAVHWGMTIAVYPFWGVVADITGRLLRLQGSASMAQILLRIKEQFGERQTANRSAQRIVRSFVDWGVLLDMSDKGIYSMSPQADINDDKLAAWLIEATLRSTGSKSAPLKSIINSPAIFPFKIKAFPVTMLNSARIEINRQGLDEDVVILKAV